MPTMVKGILIKASKLLIKSYFATFAIKAIAMFLGELAESKIRINSAVAQVGLCTSNQQVRLIMSKTCEEAAITATKWPLLESMKYTAEHTHSCLNVSCMVILEGLAIYLLPLLITTLIVAVSLSYIIGKVYNNKSNWNKHIPRIPWKTTKSTRIEDVTDSNVNVTTALVEKK
jgi:hypothetical protein